MKSKKAFFLVVPMVLGLFQVVWTRAGAHAAPGPRTLKVKLNYTGTGTVDEKHRIYVMVFDANPYTASSLVDATSQPTPPAPSPGVSHILRRESGATRNATITFRELAVSPVFAMAFFDRSGTYNGHDDPASGSPMGGYGTSLDKLEPIELDSGKIVEITLSFDDSKSTP